jgi:hypothetical protein
LKETLRIFRIGLTIGLLDRETWLTWLKSTVAREKKPATELVELSTLDPKAHLYITLNLLDHLIGPRQSGNAAQILMRLIYDASKAGQISATKAVLLHLYRSAPDGSRTSLPKWAG